MNSIHSKNEYDIERLNDAIKDNVELMIRKIESRHISDIDYAAQKIIDSGLGLKIILVSGPSAAGKTTFCKRLCKRIEELGREATHFSLDNFFYGRSHIPVNEDGTLDMENIACLDTDGVNGFLKKLLKDGNADYPTYDFPTQSRNSEWNNMKLKKNGIIAVEGIHALNPVIVKGIPEKAIIRIYIDMGSSYKLGTYEVLSPDETRLIRRAVRDERDRGWSIEDTFMNWKSVRNGEKLYIDPYIESADIKLNTSIAYEPSVIRGSMIPLLRSIKEDSDFYEKAKDIIGKLELFRQINSGLLTEDSLIHEFIG